MITMSATEFRAKCFHVLDRVQKTGEAVRVTKWGKVLAEVLPVGHRLVNHAEPGFARDVMRVNGDILAPLDVTWEVLM